MSHPIGIISIHPNAVRLIGDVDAREIVQPFTVLNATMNGLIDAGLSGEAVIMATLQVGVDAIAETVLENNGAYERLKQAVLRDIEPAFESHKLLHEEHLRQRR